MFKAQIYMISLYSILLILFHRRMIFKMLVLEQSPEKSPFSAGEGGIFRPLRPPLATGLVCHVHHVPVSKRLNTSWFFF